MSCPEVENKKQNNVRAILTTPSISSMALIIILHFPIYLLIH